ncbi:hypothetical protein FEM08_13170 [Flavobacterium gilvum]|nr:hypothetical protein FEM08_13170 [Flavobacterium gilvum]
MYGLVPGQTFEQQFSVVSIENIIFSIIAFILSFHEKIVETNANNTRPQNQQNLKQTMLDYHDGLDLVWINGGWQYDLTGVADAEERKIIDRCAVLESDEGLVFKVATDNAGNLEPVTPAQQIRIEAYIIKKKMPGVPFSLINQTADLIKANLTVYVNPLVIDLPTGKLLSATTDVYPVKDAIQLYLANLEFDGAFVKDFFRTTLKEAEGIELVVINSIQSKFAGFPFIDTGEWRIPDAGYFKLLDENLTITYLPYALASN